MAQTVGAVFELRDRFTAKAREVTGATKNLETNINGATSSMKSFNNNSGLAGRGLDNLKGKITGLIAGYVSLKGASKLANSAVGESSGLEQYRNTLNTVMKDTKKAGETMAWAVDFANRTPFETNQVVDGTVKLQSYGLVAKDVMTQIGDMSAVMGKSLDQGVEAIADAQAGELERLKEFGITKQMIIDHGSKIMKGKELVNNKGQIVDQQNFNKALFSLMEERYKGGMEIQSKTLKGTMSTVTGVAKNALAQLMGVTADGTIKVGGLFDKLKNKVNIVADTLQKWSNDGTIERATKKIEDGFTFAGNAIKWVKDNANWLIPVVGGLAGALGALKVINTVKVMMDLWKASTIAQTIAQGGLNAVLAANPIGIVILIIGALVAAGVALYMHWDVVKEKAGELWTNIKNIFENIKNSVIEKWNAIKEFLKNPIKGVINIAKNIASGGEAKDEFDGSHANGLGRVPFDGYRAELHKDEMVLTKNQAENYRKGESNSSTNTKSAPIINININGTNKSTQEIINEIIPPLKLAINNM